MYRRKCLKSLINKAKKPNWIEIENSIQKEIRKKRVSKKAGLKSIKELSNYADNDIYFSGKLKNPTSDVLIKLVKIYFNLK